MGMDLHRPDGSAFNGKESFHANWSGWTYLLDMAGDGGWEPAGTLAPSGSTEWPGRYDTNDGQVVTAADASAIADALIRVKDAWEWNPSYREFVREFISYCRGGAFAIW